ncbi:hypothetical protein CORC01_09850 [Colletotrichum orchidophilum]|uniref:Uncharacterized protein n=1 Tax=Colletotrichum orchidophilum TaxID=1209926 RepID=A0A1G4B0K3_9PEZI|nr:uncharacterized protein CORC01_09850 [Colletotrichum orchidophilum]OHE94832.1 hypothetical protein CORC01_09850 [Colletotrichum orchidophilum]
MSDVNMGRHYPPLNRVREDMNSTAGNRKKFVIKVAALLACLKVRESPDEGDDGPSDNRTNLLFEFDKALNFEFGNMPIATKVLEQISSVDPAELLLDTLSDDELESAGHSMCDVDDDLFNDKDDEPSRSDIESGEGSDLSDTGRLDDEHGGAESDFAEGSDVSDKSYASDAEDDSDTDQAAKHEASKDGAQRYRKTPGEGAEAKNEGFVRKVPTSGVNSSLSFSRLSARNKFRRLYYDQNQKRLLVPYYTHPIYFIKSLPQRIDHQLQDANSTSVETPVVPPATSAPAFSRPPVGLPYIMSRRSSALAVLVLQLAVAAVKATSAAEILSQVPSCASGSPSNLIKLQRRWREPYTKRIQKHREGRKSNGRLSSAAASS